MRRQRTLVILFALLILSFSGASQWAGQSSVPDSPARKRATGFIALLNNGNDEQLETFAQENFSVAALARRSKEDRISMYHQLRNDMGAVEIDHMLGAGERAITAFVKSSKGKWFQFDFTFEQGTDQKVASMRVEILDHPPESASNAPVENGQTTGQPVRVQLTDYADRIASLGFTGALVVTTPSGTLLEHGFGMANRMRHIPITPDTVVSIGSNTKDFTAVAILQLETEGKLSIEDPITKYFKNVPADKANITIQNLLKHTSGIDSDGDGDFDDVSRTDLQQRVFASPLRSKPGTEFHYSNAGYSLLAAIIEDVGGEPYERFFTDHILKTLGLKNTGFLLPHWDLDQIAHGYEGGDDWGTMLSHPHLPDGPYWNLRGNGCTLSTLREMDKFYRALWGDKILPASEREKMFAPKNAVALAGGNGVYFFIYRYYPAQGLAVTAFSSDSGMIADRISGDVGRIALGQAVTLPPHAIVVDSAKLGLFTGIYDLTPSGSSIVAAVDGGQLVISADGQQAMSLLFTGSVDSSERNSVLNARAQKILEATSKDDYQPLHAAIGGEMPLEAVETNDRRRHKNWERQFGPQKGFRVLGTTQSGREAETTHIRLDFERGVVSLDYVWEGDQLTGIRFSPGLSGWKLYPESESSFASYDFETGKIILVRFNISKSGNTTELTIATPSGDVSAKHK